MNHNLSEIQDLNELSNRDSRSTYSIVSEDLGQQLLQLIQEYQPNPQDQYLLELSKQKTVLEIDDKFRSSSINQTYTFPRKVTQHDRNKAKELSQILANSSQNKYLKIKQQQGIVDQSQVTNKNQMPQNSNINGTKMLLDQRNNDQMEEDLDNSFSSLNDCTFYDLNSQNNISHDKSKLMKKQLQQQYLNNMQNVIQSEQSQTNQNQIQQQNNQGDQQNKIKHSYYAPHHLQKQQQPTQFVKSMINQYYQQPQNIQQNENAYPINKQHFHQFDMEESNFKDSDMINIEIHLNEQDQMAQQNRRNDENRNIEQSEMISEQILNGNAKTQKAVLNNLIQSSQNTKKQNSSTKNNGQNDFNSQKFNTNQFQTNQLSGNIPQRRPLTETSPNAKNFNHLNQTGDLLQGISSSTGTTSIIGEQIASSKNKASIANSNKSDNNLKNHRIVSSQVKGVFTEADEEDEDTQKHTKEDWNEEARSLKIRQDQEGIKQQKIGYIQTEGDVMDKSPSKQYYNIPTQFGNAKVRKLKIASFHHQKEQPNKLTQSVSIHNYVESSYNNAQNIPNSNSFLPLAINSQQFANQKMQQQQPLEKISNSIKVNNYPYDLNDIQVNNNLTSKSAKQNNTLNQQIPFQLNNQAADSQNFNKIINFPQSTSNSMNGQKQFSFNQEGKLIKNIQASSQTQSTSNNYNGYSNLPNTTNIQNTKLVNMSLDYKNQDNRFTPIRSNKIPSQIHKQNQSSISNNTFNNYITNNEEIGNNTQANNNEYSVSKSNTKNRNINTSLSTVKGTVLNENQLQQEFTPTQSQASQLQKRNKTSIRKLRPKLNIDGSLNDFNENIGNLTKESQNFTQQIDPSPYTQAQKHMRNLTLNSYYIKPSTTKSSHQRQPSENLMRSSIANRVFTDKSEEKIRTTNISQCTGGVGGANSSAKVVLTESGSANNNRSTPGNASKVKRTLKIQSCKYNAQKNQLLQDQFKSSNQQQQNNIPNSSKNVTYLSNLLLQQEDDNSQNKNFYKLDQPKQLSLSKKEVSLNDAKKVNQQKDQFSNQQNQQFYQQQQFQQQLLGSTKNQQNKDMSIKEMLRQTNGRRYLKTDGDDLTDGFQHKENSLFANTNNEDKNSNQILLHKNYSTNGDLNITEASGLKMTKTNWNQQTLNIQQQFANEERLQQSSKSKSEENRITILSTQSQINNSSAYVNDLNKKRLVQQHKNTSIAKSLTSTQPITLESYSTDNPHSHQQSEQNSNPASKISNQKVNYQVKQGSNQNIKNTKIAVVAATESSQSTNGNSNVGEDKTSAIQQMNIKIITKSSIVKTNISQQDQQDEEQEQKASQLQNKKSEQLNQILVQHTSKEVKQQPYTSNAARQVKKVAGLNASFHFKTNSLVNNGNSLVGNVQKNAQETSIQNKKLETSSIHEDSLKSYQIDPVTKQPTQQKDIQEILHQTQEQTLIAPGVAVGGQIQKNINKTVGYEHISTKQGNGIVQKQKGSHIVSSLTASTDQSSSIQNGSNGGNGAYFGVQTTASSTQSNPSKNKSPMRLNFLIPTNNQTNMIPHPPQYPSSTRNQAGVGGLYKKKANQLYQSTSGQPHQQPANFSSYQ